MITETAGVATLALSKKYGARPDLLDDSGIGWNFSADSEFGGEGIGRKADITMGRLARSVGVSIGGQVKALSSHLFDGW
ncbi:hypothetical protein [Streptomyces sp. NPDC002588]|uniref:hypothetical protein n=1 Tax=Streptomyces sp. NPDC002588 TaxID=3154419 RepID=UPI00332EC420